MSKLHSDTDTAVFSEAKRARSELTRCGWGRLNPDRHETHSDSQFLPLMSDRRHSGESQLWNNSQEVVKCCFFLKKCTARIVWHMRKSCCASTSQRVDPACVRKKRSIANNKSALTWNTQWHKVSFYAPFPSDLGPGLLLLLHQ